MTVENLINNYTRNRIFKARSSVMVSSE